MPPALAGTIAQGVEKDTKIALINKALDKNPVITNGIRERFCAVGSMLSD
jgi:hypothetical protein